MSFANFPVFLTKDKSQDFGEEKELFFLSLFLPETFGPLMIFACSLFLSLKYQKEEEENLFYQLFVPKTFP